MIWMPFQCADPWILHLPGVQLTGTRTNIIQEGWEVCGSYTCKEIRMLSNMHLCEEYHTLIPFLALLLSVTAGGVWTYSLLSLTRSNKLQQPEWDLIFQSCHCRRDNNLPEIHSIWYIQAFYSYEVSLASNFFLSFYSCSLVCVLHGLQEWLGEK